MIDYTKDDILIYIYNKIQHQTYMQVRNQIDQKVIVNALDIYIQIEIQINDLIIKPLNLVNSQSYNDIIKSIHEKYK